MTELPSPVRRLVAVATTRRWALAAVLVVVLGALPQFADEFWMNVATRAMILSFFALGYNLMFGYTGMLSFGHAAFYGASAYIVAILLAGPVELPVQFGSLLPVLVIGVVGATLLAAVFGAVCVQRGGFSFAMLTLALNMLVYEVVYEYREFTGGEEGIVLASPDLNLGFATVSARGVLYYLTLVFLVASALLMWRLVNSTYGQILVAIRENPERADFVGVPVKFYKWTVFVISAFFISVVGALAAVQQVVVTPDIIFWETNTAPVVAVLIGGPTNFLGPVVGGLTFVGLEDFLSGFTRNWEIVIGLILIPTVLFFPEGILGTLDNVDSSVRTKVGSVLERIRS